LQQAQAALKEAIQHAHDAQADADKAEQELRDKRAELDARERELDIKAYEAETKRLQAMSTAMTPDQIRMMVAETVDTMLSHPDPLPAEASRPLPNVTQQPVAASPPAAPEPPAPPDPVTEPDDSAAQQPTTNPPSAGFSLPDPQQGA
jgi:predicted transcriptional regulator